ncbi:hypothetical protein [Teichococcus wenyumeiae]|nr:hypothetical protein [Pseudoroseomonas wenyumeiae]
MRDHLRTEAGTLNTLRDLTSRMPDHKAATALNEAGLLTRQGKP